MLTTALCIAANSCSETIECFLSDNHVFMHESQNCHKWKAFIAANFIPSFVISFGLFFLLIGRLPHFNNHMLFNIVCNKLPVYIKDKLYVVLCINFTETYTVPCKHCQHTVMQCSFIPPG